jgi:hypothetical protein
MPRPNVGVNTLPSPPLNLPSLCAADRGFAYISQQRGGRWIYFQQSKQILSSFYESSYYIERP